MEFLTSKNYSKLFAELSEAATAYEIAKDQDGTKVNQHRIVRVVAVQPRRQYLCGVFAGVWQASTFRFHSRQISRQPILSTPHVKANLPFTLLMGTR